MLLRARPLLSLASAKLRLNSWPMAPATPATRVLRFGTFEADLALHELRKNGRRVRLQEQPFQLLALLLERPGELVTRQELQAVLWPDTTVDYDHGLNKAVSKVRAA